MSAHARQRAQERYGLDLTPGMEAEVIRKIASGEGLLLGQQADGRVRYLVMLGAQAIPVVFSPDTQTVITVLPRNPRAQKVGGATQVPINKFARRRRAHASW